MANKKTPDRVLRTRSDFEKLKSQGKRNSPTRWMTLVTISNSAGHTRFAFTLSRKIGTAVTRNRLRRWGRELFRELLVTQGLEMGVDINVVLRPMGSEFYSKMERLVFREALSRGFQSVYSRHTMDRSPSDRIL